jgi:hypothetical protein
MRFKQSLGVRFGKEAKPETPTLFCPFGLSRAQIGIDIRRTMALE